MRNEATVHVIYEKRTKKNKCPLKLRVTFARIPHAYSTNSKEEFTKEEYKKLKQQVQKGRMKYPSSVEKAKRIAEEIIQRLGPNFSFDTFNKLYRRQLFGNYASTESLQAVYDRYVTEHPRSLAVHTIKDYQGAVNWAKKVKAEVKVGDITAEFVKKMNGLFEEANMSINTRKIYFRELKAIYLFAVKEGLIVDTNPFGAWSLASTRKQNIGLTEADLSKIVNYQGTNRIAQFGRDFFLLSFYCNGNYLSDVLRLQNKNISEDGHVRFSREKTKYTGLMITFYLIDHARTLLNKYGEIDPSKPNEYILPYLRGKTDEQQVSIVHDINNRVRKGLKVLATELGLHTITAKQARNTYASIAHESSRGIRDIQADLGHTHIQTTIDYINSISGTAIQQGKELKQRFVPKQIEGAL